MPRPHPFRYLAQTTRFRLLLLTGAPTDRSIFLLEAELMRFFAFSANALETRRAILITGKTDNCSYSCISSQSTGK